MKKIWIFGDSYSVEHENCKYSWPVRLKNNYIVKNFSLGGTGPEYQLDVFKKIILNTSLEELKSIDLIFLISSNSRKNFSFYTDPSHQSFGLSIANQNKFDYKPFNKIIRQYSQYTNFLKDFFKFYYLYNTQDFDMLHIHQILFIKEFSKFFNKGLVISVFDNTSESAICKKFNNILDSTNTFTYAKGLPLYYIEKEIYKFAPNHLSEKNHSLLYEQMVNWIENNISVDTDKLKKIY